MNKYDNIDFCINTLYDYVHKKDKTDECYKIKYIQTNNLNLINAKKPSDYNYDDVIKMIAPRKVLIYAPLRDRFTDADDVSNCIEKAEKAWINRKNFEFKNPDDICRFQKDQQDVVLEWLNNLKK